MSTSASTRARTWTVDASHSNIGFSTRHMMIAKVRGNFARVLGELRIPEGCAIPKSVLAVIETACIDTREDRRDDHLRSADFLDVENHPKLTFVSTSIRSLGDTAFEMIGDLTIRGTSRCVSFAVEVQGQSADPWGNQRICYAATLRVDRRDFGLTFNQVLGTGGVLIGNDIDIELDIEAVAPFEMTAN